MRSRSTISPRFTGQRIAIPTIASSFSHRRHTGTQRQLVTREAGTIVVPGHGRLCDAYDVVDYRDMVTIIRDRVRDLIKAGRSLADVKAAQPAKGYVGRYGNVGGTWTTDRFVEAVYITLSKAGLSAPKGAER